MSIRSLYYALSPELRLSVRKIYYWPHDLYRKLFGEKGTMEPGKGDIYVGSGDFIEQGKKQAQQLKEHIDLRSDDVVLDIGSGIGRTAVPLTEIITTGQYEGFDVVKKGVDWCQKNITTKYPNFSFKFVPLHNDLYNTFDTKVSEFKFPYPNHHFDKVFLFSVFTHMKTHEIQHYLKEIQRVMKPEGKCLATFFLYDENTEKAIANNEGFSFPHQFSEGYRLMNKKVESANIAVSIPLLQKMTENAGLEIENIQLGYWSGFVSKETAGHFQDIAIIKNK